MANVENSPTKNVKLSPTPTPELASTQELVGIESGDITKTTTLEGNQVVADKVSIYEGDITKLEVDAIVNAAKESLLGGGGVDGAIHKAAGRKLLKECKQLNGCKTGEAKITSGYKLPAKHIIHTVGPQGENKKMLKACYKSSMQLLTEQNLKTIAFPCISTGIYGYPQEKAASVAIKTVTKFIEKNPEKIEHVTFCLFNKADVEIYKKLMQQHFPGKNIEEVLDDENSHKINDVQTSKSPTIQEQIVQDNVTVAAKKRPLSDAEGTDEETENAHVRKAMRERNKRLKRKKESMVEDLVNPSGRKGTENENLDKPTSPKPEMKLKEKVVSKMSKQLEKVRAILTGKRKYGSDEDLSPDSGDDKTWEPSKNKEPRSSDDFISDPKKAIKKKRLTKRRSKVKDKGKGDKKTVEAEKSEEEGDKPTQKRRPRVLFTDFAANNFELATPTGVAKEEYLTWDEVLNIANDDSVPHGNVKSYLEPKGNEVYKFTEVMTNPEAVKTFAHRDNYYSIAYGGSQPSKTMKRYRYLTKSIKDGNWSHDFKKYVFTIPEKQCMLIQYIGDPNLALQYTKPPTTSVSKSKNESSDDEARTASTKPRLKMLDESDFEMTDKGEEEPVDDMTQEEYMEQLRQRKQESIARREEKRNNNLALFLKTFETNSQVEPTQHQPHIPMNQKQEAEEALVLEDEDQPLTSRQIEAIVNEAVRQGEGIQDANTTYISVPEGGKVYLFDCTKISIPWTKLLLNDGYRYKMRDHLYMTRSTFDKSKYYGYQWNEVLEKMIPTTNFKRYTYFNTASGMLAIHYRGNVKDVSRVPHGNAKKSKHVFIPTSKSLSLDIKEKYVGDTRRSTYHSLTSKLPGGVASSIVGPRNPKAVGYLMKKEQNQSWVNHLEEGKKVTLASDFLGPFVRNSTSHPYYAATLATDDGLTEMRRVINNMPEGKRLVMHYDTTFEFGNFYVSILSFRHPFLRTTTTSHKEDRSDALIVPVFIMIHQKKFAYTHKFLMDSAIHAYDERYTHATHTFANIPKVLVSDGEFLGHELLPNCATVHCWRHLKANVKRQAEYKKHLRPVEVDIIMTEFGRILKSRSRESYINRRDEILGQSNWKNTGMADYFMSRIDDEILNYAGRWVLDELGVGHGHHGITNNPSETVNSVIHSIKDKNALRQMHKDYTIDDTLYFFHNYCQLSDKELQLSYFGTGTFQVRPEYSKKFEKQLKLLPPIYVMSIQELKDAVRDRVDPKHDPLTTETPDKVKPPASTLEAKRKEFDKMAKYTADSNRVVKVPHLRMFFGVRDIGTENMCWVDYMKDECTCPIGSSQPCPHKRAVQIKYSLPDPKSKKRISTKDKGMGHHIASDATAIYGTKAPTRDDTYSIAVHGVKKEKASLLKQAEKDVLNEYEESKTFIDDDGVLVNIQKKPTFASIFEGYKKTLHKETVTLKSWDDNPSPETAFVCPYTTKIFKIGDDEKFAIFSPRKNYAVVLYHAKDKNNVEKSNIFKLAALSTKKSATFSVHSFNKPMAAISYRIVGEKTDLTAAVTELHKRGGTETAPQVHVELGCFCRQPFTVDEEKTNVAKCSKCRANFHKNCLDNEDTNSYDETLTKWVCKPCKIPRNIEWGHKGRFTNTCTVDNWFQTVFLALYENTRLLKQFPQDEAHNTLKECLASIAKNNCFQAHEKWYDFVKRNNCSALSYPDDGNNFWGMSRECTTELLKEGKTFERLMNCPNKDCPEQIQVHDKTEQLYIRSNEGPAKQQIRTLLSDRRSKRCQHCGDKNLSGTKLQFSPENHVWFIEFMGTGYNTANDETHKLDLDKTLLIPDRDGKEHTFKLQSITIAQKARNHFVSIHRVDDSLIFADHMLERQRDGTERKRPTEYRYRAPMPSDHDFLGPNRATINSIVYVRQYE